MARITSRNTLLKKLTTTINTAKGHFDQEQKNLQSTEIPYEEIETDLDKYPTNNKPSKHMNVQPVYNHLTPKAKVIWTSQVAFR